MSWKNNASFTDWKTSLRELLADAQSAVQNQNDAAVETVYLDLESFIAASDDTIVGVAELDLVARQTMRDLIVVAVDWNVQKIADRTADVAELEKRFATKSEANKSIAGELRLERVKAVLDASAHTIGSLRALSDALPSDLSAVSAQIDQQIQDAINALKKLGVAVQTKL